MSTQVREAIAAAASTVDGISVTPYFRQVTKPNQGFVRRSRTDYPNTFGGVVTWAVVVVMPAATVEDTERWLDENGPALVAAVEGEMTVTSMVPFIATDAGNAPYVVIEGTREEE